MRVLMRPEFTALPAVKKHALITMRHRRRNGCLPTFAIAVAVSSMDPAVWNSIVAKHKMGNLAVLKNLLSVKREGNAPIAENSSWEEKYKAIIAVVGNDYRGELPPKKDYVPEGMNKEGKEKFEKWYEEKKSKGVQFHLRQELEDYCMDDVWLLREGCLAFQRDFRKRTRFCPFEQITIASACNQDLRLNPMEENTIASEPLYGDDSSNPRFRQRIQPARNQGEYRIPDTQWTVDGYDVETNTVYEFLGCFWHGYPKCFPQRSETYRRLNDRSMADVHQETVLRLQSLSDRGYSVKTIWECEWQKCKNHDLEIAEIVAGYDLEEPPSPCDAFFGGRTNAVRLHYEVKEHAAEQIKYYDYTSLYPWTNKTQKYPVGHSEMIYASPREKPISDYFGLAKWEKKQLYITQFQEKEGISLEYEKITVNPGQRALAKLMLNSMWGKFGQQVNKLQVKEFIEPQAFCSFMDSDQRDVRYVSCIDEQRVEVHHREEALCENISPNLNIFLACFTTCWARLRLYEALELLNERVLYFDTDTITYPYGYQGLDSEDEDLIVTMVELLDEDDE
ncbi:uncharacterized protein [Montipora capricornis]|uniref:uncharacterized protein n=1 Tax=Montipora capricornis TaxID=246305 RepID=UPI0035F19595